MYKQIMYVDTIYVVSTAENQHYRKLVVCPICRVQKKKPLSKESSEIGILWEYKSWIQIRNCSLLIIMIYCPDDQWGFLK
jgi:hypothetical protein